MTGWDLIDELERVIRLILEYPQGLSILLGSAEVPKSSAIVQAFPPAHFDNLGIRGQFTAEAERITMAASRIDEIIKAAGGWQHITECVQDWKKGHGSDWSMVAMHISYIRSNKRSLDGPTLERIADMFGVSKKRVCKARKNFAGTLADFILFRPIGGNETGDVTTPEQATRGERNGH